MKDTGNEKVKKIPLCSFIVRFVLKYSQNSIKDKVAECFDTFSDISLNNI